MDQLPQIGDGVRIPWGLEQVGGEVVDLVPPNHAVVEVPVVDASGETIDRNAIRFPLDSLEPLPPWRVVKSRQGAPESGADAAISWWIDAARNGDRAKTEVRVSRTLAQTTSGHIPAESQDAISTSGRSAVQKFARRFRLPRVIVVGTGGVFELNE